MRCQKLGGVRGVLLRQVIFFGLLGSILVILGKACDHIQREDSRLPNITEVSK